MSDFVALTVFAGLPVRNLDSAVRWYSQLFGRAPDGRPTPLIADYYLGAGQIPENGTLQLREDAGRAGGGLMTINVDDIEVVSRVLQSLHASLETHRFPIEALTVSEVTVGTFEDPDGNAITVVQPHRR